MADVAAAAGVSLKTVSRVLTGEGSVRPATAERVRTAVGQLRYRRNEEAASLRRGEPSAVLGLLLDDLTDPVSTAIARAADQVGRRRGYVSLIAASDQDRDRERRLVHALCRQGVDGLLVLPAGGDHAVLAAELGEEMAAGTPVVLIDAPPSAVGADRVVVAHADGVRHGVERLVAAGYRRVGYLGGPPGSFAEDERYRGYRAALAGAGGAVDDRLVRRHLRQAADARVAVHDLLELDDPPTALFAAGTRLTIGAVHALAVRDVPVEVLGVDDLGVAELAPRPLTVVAADAGAVGRTAAELLLRRIDGDRRPTTHVSLDVELVRCGRDAATG